MGKKNKKNKKNYFNDDSYFGEFEQNLSQIYSLPIMVKLREKMFCIKYQIFQVYVLV